METPTIQEIEQHISSAFDSVNLINQLNAKQELTEEETNSVTRNTKHLQIMMNKAWFVSALSVEQKQQIDAIV